MKVMITGGAGFIGSHLVDYYVEKGDDVVVVDNLITGSFENIHRHHGIKYIHHDVCVDLLGDCDINLIYHLACPASPKDYLQYPIETMRTMSVGTYNMLEYARRNGSKFILASTSEVYGDPEQHPQTENYNGNVNTICKRAVYDESKRFAETLTRTYYDKYNLDIGIARIFNTYGPRMRINDGRVISNFINQGLNKQDFTIYGDGEQTRSFCYIDDMIEALVKMSKVWFFRPINLGNPEEHTILNVAKMVSVAMGIEPHYIFSSMMEGDPKQRRPDIMRAKYILDWKPKTMLCDGLVKTIEWFKAQKEMNN